MAFRECGVNSLFELICMVIFSCGFAFGIAYAWVYALDYYYDPGDLDLSALNTLHLIIGFLYVGLIRNARETWIRATKGTNDFMMTTHNIVIIIKRIPSFRPLLTKIVNLRKAVDDFFSADESQLHHVIRLLCCYSGVHRVKRKVAMCLSLRQKVSDFNIEIMSYQNKSPEYTRLMEQTRNLERCATALESQYFEREPACFKWHLRLLIFIYFASLPPQLFNSYGALGCYIIYPIMIYFLFAVALLAVVFDNPVKHPELNTCFEMLNNELRNDVKNVNTNQYLRVLPLDRR